MDIGQNRKATRGLTKQLLRILSAMLVLLLLTGCSIDPDRNVKLQLYFFSAGKADAILLNTAQGTVLVDAGEKGFGREIIAYLEEQGIDAIDTMIITHFDQDHVGGAARVLNRFPVKQVLQSNCPQDGEEYENYCRALEKTGLEPVTVRETVTLALGEAIVTVDPPKKEHYDTSESNNSSLIVSVECGSNHLLLPGDAENERLEEFLPDARESYDLVKLPHHGEYCRELKSLVLSTQPRYTIITTGATEIDDSKTAQLMEICGTEVFLTAKAPVVVQCTRSTLKVFYDTQSCP